MIRKVVLNDINALKEVVDSSGLFPSEYLDEMIADYFSNADTEDIWFTYVDNNIPVAIGYCAPEKLTNGTYNLYAIGVKKELQQNGIGRQMMCYLEKLLRKNNRRILIVETSSLDEYAIARNFYDKLGYRREAIIKDFWDEGEDKIIFWKKLNVVRYE